MIRFFSPLAQPIGFIWLLLVILVVWLFRKKNRRAASAVGAIALLINIIGNDTVPRLLLASLEKPYAQSGFEKIPNADAVVMLGGTHRPSPFDAFGMDLTASSDRIVTALELMRLGKGQTLVLGGNGYVEDGQRKRDVDLLKAWLAAWKIPQAPVLDLDINRNTQEEAVKVQALMKEKGWKVIVLVTSAFHMRRAEAVFRQLGINVVPVACDFQAYDGRTHGSSEGDFGLFPRIEGFQHLGLYIHEQGGWLVYRWRGWVGGK